MTGERNNKTDMHTIVDELKKIHHNLIVESPKCVQTVEVNILHLEQILLSNDFTEEQQDVILSIFDQDQSKIHAYIEDYSVVIENEFAEKTISEKKLNLALFKKSLWYHEFINLVRDEIKMGKISKDDKVLFIGSGPFPITAILYATYTGCQVDCLEKNKKNVEVSKKLLQSLGLSDLITVYHKLGQDFVNSNYTIIVLPSQALPKDKILNRIHEQMPAQTSVICRVRNGLGKIYYESQLDDRLLDLFSIVDRAYMSNQVAVSLLLNKN